MAYLGDGVCNEGIGGPDFNCEAFSFDDGDCVDDDDGSDTGGSVGGGSTSGSGTDGGSTDGGEPAECDETVGLIPDCIGGCIEVTASMIRLADGICDAELYCEDFGFDSGLGGADCAEPGGGCMRDAGEVGVWDCLTDTCRPTSWLGDGGCDDWADMSCAETGWDGGDCPPD
jgi:hypothetical protein